MLTSRRSIWRLRYWLPRSMAGLVAASCLVAAVPLMTAVVMAGLALERVSSRGEALVNEGIVLERLIMALRTEVHSLDRNVRQYRVVRDSELLKLFVTRTAKLQELLAGIRSHDFRPGSEAPADTARDHLRAAQRTVAVISRLFSDPPVSDVPVEEVVALLGQLRLESEALATSATHDIDLKAEALRGAGRNAQNVMMLSAVAFAPLTILLALALFLLLSRPLKQLARCVTALGHGRYEQPIVITYPQEMVQLGRKLDWLRQRLARLEADKEQFLRHVSHELKSPLASLSEGVSLLLQGSLGPVTDPQLEVIQILDESTSGLDMQIRRLIAFAKWREGKEAEAQWFEASRLVDDILRAHKPSMMRRSLQTRTVIEHDALFGVRDQLRVALENIVVNAISHAPPRSDIEIEIRYRPSHFAASVRDFGRGIPESNKRRIFEPYVQGDSDEAASIRGSGLGLSIVDEIVLSHGGEVEVEDAQPGARFTMVWPIPKTEPDRAAVGQYAGPDRLRAPVVDGRGMVAHSEGNPRTDRIR